MKYILLTLLISATFPTLSQASQGSAAGGIGRKHPTQFLVYKTLDPKALYSALVVAIQGQEIDTTNAQKPAKAIAYLCGGTVHLPTSFANWHWDDRVPTKYGVEGTGCNIGMYNADMDSGFKGWKSDYFHAEQTVNFMRNIVYSSYGDSNETVMIGLSPRDFKTAHFLSTSVTPTQDGKPQVDNYREEFRLDRKEFTTREDLGGAPVDVVLDVDRDNGHVTDPKNPEDPLSLLRR